jgi:hypothetical protein
VGPSDKLASAFYDFFAQCIQVLVPAAASLDDYAKVLVFVDLLQLLAVY